MNKNSGFPESILIVLPDLRGGGAERLHVYLAESWRKRGVKVTFALMSATGELLELLDPEIRVISLQVRRIREVLFPLRNVIKQLCPDVVLSAMWPLTAVSVAAWFLAGKQGRIFLSDHNQLSISCLKELHISPALLGLTMRLAYPAANGLIAVSEGVKKDLLSLGGFREDQVEVIYNPAATGIAIRAIPLKLAEEMWGQDSGKRILAVGTLKEQKDHATLLRAFALLLKDTDATLAILGEGPLRDSLRRLADELGISERVRFPGFVIDPYPWFLSADVFVLSSRWEGFGNVIVEALECALPVVSTDCQSGPAEILGNGEFGVLVPVGQPDAMCAAIKSSLVSKFEKNKLRQRAADFSVEKIASQYLAYFSRR